LSFDQNIRSLTGTDVALVCAAITGGLSFVDFGNIAVNYYRSNNINAKAMYYTKIKYGHKTMPGVYHKYVTTWYSKKSRKSKYKVGTTFFVGEKICGLLVNASKTIKILASLIAIAFFVIGQICFAGTRWNYVTVFFLAGTLPLIGCVFKNMNE
jgi:hypothetical protein